MTNRLENINPALNDRTFDVICIGTALIDHLSFADLSTVAEIGVSPRTMTLIDDLTAARARATLGEAKIVSGGTVANTAAGIASFSGRPAFLGAVARDAFGEQYSRDLSDAGVTPLLVEIASDDDAATGACYVMVTPDQERTMATHLGVSGLLSADDIDDDLLGQCRLCYFDGYLLDFPEAERLVEKIVSSAKKYNTTLALGLADPFVVERHRDALIALLPHVSLLFSNQDEIQSLSGLGSVVDAADKYRLDAMTVVVTRGELGAVIVGPSGVIEIAAVPVETVVDVTGAGDLFAAGMIYGIVRGVDTATGARLGALAASEVISHLGARPECSLIDLARSSGIIQ